MTHCFHFNPRYCWTVIIIALAVLLFGYSFLQASLALYSGAYVYDASLVDRVFPLAYLAAIYVFLLNLYFMMFKPYALEFGEKEIVYRNKYGLKKIIPIEDILEVGSFVDPPGHLRLTIKTSMKVYNWTINHIKIDKSNLEKLCESVCIRG